MALGPGPACLLGVGYGEISTLLAASTPSPLPSPVLSLYSLGLSPNRVGLAHLGLSPSPSSGLAVEPEGPMTGTSISISTALT